MRSVVGILMVLTLIGALSPVHAKTTKSESWKKDKACGRRILSEQSSLEECDQADCARISQTAKICACLSSPFECSILYEKDGKIVQKWNTELAPFGGTFRVDAADFDGDGQEEYIVAIMNAVSNGMGVEYWTVWVITNGKLSNPVQIQDYGVMGFPTSDGKKCRLLVTKWIEGWEPKKGSGLYLVGRWFELYGNDLYPMTDRPAIKRRYLKRFSDIRSRELSRDHPRPLLWFQAPEATPIIGPYPFRE